MKDTELLAALKEHYPIAFERVERLRDAGSTTYAAYAERENYFVKLTKPAFGDTVEGAVQLHLLLQATVIEFTGLEQFTDAFFDRQLDWLLRWGEQCEESEWRDPCAKGVFDHSGTDRASAGQRA